MYIKGLDRRYIIEEAGILESRRGERELAGKRIYEGITENLKSRTHHNGVYDHGHQTPTMKGWYLVWDQSRLLVWKFVFRSAKTGGGQLERQVP